MEQSAQRKTMLITIGVVIGASVLLVIGFGITLIGSKSDTSSLAFQVPATNTTYFLRTADRALLEHQLNRVTTDTSIDVPEGSMYELAEVQNGSGSSRIVRFEHGEEEGTIVLSGQESSISLLPPQDVRLSLGRTPLLQSYVGAQDKEYAWVSPTTFEDYHSILGPLLRAAIHPDSSGILVLFGTEGRRSAIISAPRASAYTPIHDTGTLEPAPHLAIEVGDPASILQTLHDGLRRENNNLREGFSGMIAYALREKTGSSNLAAFMKDLVTGPMQIVITDDGTLAAEGTARTAEVGRKWLTDMAHAQSLSVKRELSFMKNENIRTDIVTASGTTPQELEKYKDWELLRIGENLSAAQRGREYMLSPDASVTKHMIDARESPVTQEGQLPSARGIIDVPWILNALETSAPEMANGMREDVLTNIGRLPARISWAIKPVSVGWLIEWTEE